jgi:hypothetical protein
VSSISRTNLSRFWTFHLVSNSTTLPAFCVVTQFVSICCHCFFASVHWGSWFLWQYFFQEKACANFWQVVNITIHCDFQQKTKTRPRSADRNKTSQWNHACHFVPPWSDRFILPNSSSEMMSTFYVLVLILFPSSFLFFSPFLLFDFPFRSFLIGSYSSHPSFRVPASDPNLLAVQKCSGPHHNAAHLAPVNTWHLQI